VDGISAAQAIRKLPEPHRDTKIIAVTASLSTDGVQRCLAAGMNDYVGKPIIPEALDQAIRRVMGFAAGPAPEGTMPVPYGTPDGEFDPQPLETLRQDLGLETTLDLVETFLEIAPEFSVGLAAFAQDRDCPRMAELGHSLKSSAASLGLREIQRLAQTLEQAGLASDVEGTTRYTESLKLALDSGVTWLRGRAMEMKQSMVAGLKNAG
jgi:CheY-like chemotaxis protein